MTISKRAAWVIPAVFTFVAIGTLAVPSSVNAHCKGKHTGNHEHCTIGGNGPSDDYTSSNSEVQFTSPSDVAGFHYHIIGTPDQEEIRAGSGRDLIEAGASNDFILGRGNHDEIYGGDGGDDLYGGDGDDLLYGGAGDDLIDGGDGTDVLDGGSGNDGLNGGAGTDYLLGGDGNDSLNFSFGQSNGTGFDSDIYDGGNGDRDELQFRTGSEPPYDAIVGFTVDLAAGTYEARLDDPVLGLTIVAGTFSNIEGIVASDGNDTLYGTDGPALYLHGSEGSDIIFGRGGNDGNIDGGPGRATTVCTAMVVPTTCMEVTVTTF